MDTNFNTLCQLCSLNTRINDLKPKSINWQDIWQLALRHRVVPVMADRLKKLGIAVPDEIARQIAEHNRENLLKGMGQLAELVRLTRLFDKENIQFVVFKGIALSHLTGQGLHQRHNGDIDILLASLQNLWQADNLLSKAGYQRIHPPVNLNAKQKHHLLQYDKDFRYIHTDKEILLEVHFKLLPSNTMCSLLPLPIEIYKNRSTFILNDQVIPIMNKQTHLVYLLMHGAISRWFRLKWLCDIPYISQNGKDYFQPPILKIIKNPEANRMISQGLCLAEKYFKMPIPDKVRDSACSKNKFIIEVASSFLTNQKTIRETRPDFSIKLPLYYWNLMRYKLILMKSMSYKKDVIWAYSTDSDDWQILSLPSALFWLYYPLHPLLWLKRQL